MHFQNNSQSIVATGANQLPLPRVGRINFSNCLPINLPIERGLVSINADFVDGTPQELNTLFQSGALELSSTSSFLYIKHKGELVLLPDLSISSRGPVGSVLFFWKGKTNDLREKTIEVPDASATSIRLLSLILKLEHGIDAKLQVVKEPRLDRADTHGALVIGDRALEVDDRWSERAERIDLGEWWTNRFQLPMVFGVFVAKTSFAEHSPDRYRHIAEGLRQAKRLGTSTMQDEVIDRASILTGLSKERMSRYFLRELDYNLESAHMESLNLFHRLLTENGLI